MKPWLGWQSYRNSALNIRRSFENQLWNRTNLVENAIVLQHANNYDFDYLSHVIRLNMIWRQFYATGKTAFQVREYAGHSTKFSIENVLSYDKRDRQILPETGYFAKYGVELAALVGDSSFVRNELFLQVSC
jgi:outer membrane protein assembly factor BamA